MKIARKKTYISLLAAVLVVAVLVGMMIPVLAKVDWPTKVERFEKYNPVYTEIVEPGTKLKDIKLPETLRAIVSLSELHLEADSFVQAEPAVDKSDGYEYYDYYNYGYVAPKGAADLYAAGEPVIYSIYYADQAKSNDAQSQGDKVSEVAYRVFGSVNGSENTWFDCDKDGNIKGAVLNVPVTWNDGGYNANAEGEYTFTANVTGYTNGKARPYAKITVKKSLSQEDTQNQKEETPTEDTSQEKKPESTPLQQAPAQQDKPKQETATEKAPTSHDCHCGPNGEAIDQDNFPWAHQEDCPNYSPVECMCREHTQTEVTDYDEDGTVTGTHTELIPGDYSHVHDLNNLDCPLHGRETVRIKKLKTGQESVMGKDDAERIVAAQKQGKVLYPALGEIEILPNNQQYVSNSKVNSNNTMAAFSSNSGGANDAAMNQFQQTNTPTSGNADYISYDNIHISGAWKDYINTIWMNKAYSDFSWTSAAAVNAYNGWAWSGQAANETTGTVTTNPKRIPAKSGATWTVYSGEQLRYALTNLGDGDTIVLGGNIDLNGSMYSWTEIDLLNSLGQRSLTLNGNHYGIYNLGQFITSTTSVTGGLFSRYFSLTARNITFHTAKLVGNSGHLGIFGVGLYGNGIAKTYARTLDNVKIIDSMLRGREYVSPFGSMSLLDKLNTINVNVSNSSSEGCYLYGGNHVGAFSVGIDNSRITNSFSQGNLIASHGGHTGGFISCYAYNVNVDSCFAVNEIYGTTYIGGFAGLTGKATISNCFSSGKIEGYQFLGGFLSSAKDSVVNGASTIRNCYSTALVGMRTESRNIGAFYATQTRISPQISIYTISDCYAAGEAGNTNTDMITPGNIGGFLSETKSTEQLSNCYYDKQTTAMREWAAGNNKTVNGVTGVLTTSTAGQTGIASGTYGGSADRGFKGFSDNTQWVYTNEHYPQLNVFANASATDWVDAETADMVRAYSLASTSTVMLGTWDKGYDWNDNGVRTKNEVSYDRTLASTGKSDHKGNEYTYDTVREIVSPFQVTGNASYSHMVGSGAPSKKVNQDGTATTVTSTVTIDNTTKKGTIASPGMDWYKISATSGGRSVYRPIRLIGYMDIDAGSNQTILSGQRFNHRSSLVLNMMDTITDNLVVGMDDSKIWSSSKQGGYPDSNKFYAVPTTNMETNFSASRDAWIYTEIWRAKQNPDGSFVQDTENHYGYTEGSNRLVPDLSVKVTGEGTGSNLTLDEQKWNGEIPLYPDTSIQHKYIVSYYWMLSDGRYATDYKVITIEPAKYKLQLDVRSMQNGTASDPADSSSLYVGTGQDNAQGDTGYILSTNPASNSTTTDIGYSKNSAVGWKKVNGDVLVVKTQIDLYATDGTLMGTATVDDKLTAGSNITIPTNLYYSTKEYDTAQQADREVTKMQTLNITYTVQEKTDSGGKGTGEYYLRFNKLANVPSDENASALGGTNDTSGIPPEALAYINDTQFNINIAMWVSSGTDFEFIKTDENGTPFGQNQAEFQLYSCTHVHNNDCGGLIDPNLCNHYHKVDASGHIIEGEDNHAELATNTSEQAGCWAVEGPTVKTAQTDANGKVKFEKLLSGDYMLAETKTKSSYQLPTGQWLLHVNAVDGTVSIKARGVTPPAFKKETTGEGQAAVVTLKLPNYPIITLPSAGGMGPILLMIGGVAFLGVAVILFIVLQKKKR